MCGSVEESVLVRNVYFNFCLIWTRDNMPFIDQINQSYCLVGCMHLVQNSNRFQQVCSGFGKEGQKGVERQKHPFCANSIYIFRVQYRLYVYLVQSVSFWNFKALIYRFHFRFSGLTFSIRAILKVFFLVFFHFQHHFNTYLETSYKTTSILRDGDRDATIRCC